MLKAFFREPLLHFLVLGGLLFLLYGVASDDSGADPRVIRVTAAQVEQLRAQFRRTWMRPPTAAELEGLIEQHIRGEVFYREALAMGLDRDDPYVRNRLGLKLSFLLDDLSSEQATGDGELSDYLARHPQRYRVPARLSFQQVYLKSDRPPEHERRVAEILAQLAAGADPAALGDPTLLPRAFATASEPEVARVLGKDFASALFELEPGNWHGPIRSGFGWHLVQISEREPGRLPSLDAVREQVLRDWRETRRQELQARTYERLRARYEITVEPIAAAPSSLGANGPDSVAEIR
jgi:hypothetical protein